jgi:hypothetical protein
MTGNFTTQQDDNLVSASDWTSFVAVFDYYRCCAMKIRFVPSVTADTTFQYTPGYIFHDANTPTFGATLTVVVATAYENCKIVNMQRPRKYYRKIYKNLPGGTTTNSLSLRGYLPTAEPLATQCIVLFGTNTMTVAHQLGQFLVTLYVVGVARN